MNAWIVKSLLRQKFSLLASSLGVAAALLLVVIMDAAFVGESNQIVAYIHHTNPDVWVMQRGVANMHMATTFVQDWKIGRIAKVQGVKRVTPILYINTIVRAGEHKLFAYVMGLPPDGYRAGPWSMASGKPHPGPGEIVLPVELMSLAGLELGDEAIIADDKFRIVGFSRGTFSMANSVAFLSYNDLADLASARGTTSFILVDALEHQDPQDLARRIMEEVEKVNAVTQDQFIRNDFQIAKLMGVEIISFMTFIGTILAALIASFSSYSQVTLRRRELAIVKALGFGNLSLYGAVTLQSLLVSVLAFTLALLAAWVLAPTLSALVPKITLAVTLESLIRVGVITIIAAILSALVPAYLVGRVDPASAFKV